MTKLLIDGGTESRTVVLAHGAGAPMDSPFLTFFATGVAAAGLRAVRFEFPYMAERRSTGRRRAPDRTDVLVDCWRAVIAELGDPAALVIGGKSLGGRIASLVADTAQVRGLVCLGYPFHPRGRPHLLRTAHLGTLRTPTLICQGERDPLGNRDEVAGYALSPAVRLHWLADGDHGFASRVASGRSLQQNLQETLAVMLAFVHGL
jgi:predicted alpha/beta-hydrolase family hydrolase